MIRWVAMAALAAATLSRESSRSAKEKLERIETLQVPPGQSVVLTEEEINSYLRYDFASSAPAGITELTFQLQPDRVIGKAIVDFVEWQAARGERPGALLAWLLRGKRRVEVVCRYISANGQGQADIESVLIGGVPVSAAAVEFLIEQVVEPRYPDAVVGRPAELGYGLRQVKIERGKAVVTAGGPPVRAAQGALARRRPTVPKGRC